MSSDTSDDISAIKAECADVINAFAHYVDHREFDQAVSLFAQGGVFERPDMVKSGREEIASIFAGRPESHITRHLLGVPFFATVSDKEVTAVTQCTLYQTQSQDGKPPVVSGPSGVAEFRDRLVATDEGWRIARRVAVPVLFYAQ